MVRRSVAIERINPAELGRPSGFSHVVSVTSGRLAFLAGQTALDAGGQITGSGVVEQFERALGNLLTALRAAGGQPSDLVSVTIYLVDLDDYRAHGREIGEIWRRLAGRQYPAMAAVGVHRLWDPRPWVGGAGSGRYPLITRATWARAASSSRAWRVKNSSAARAPIQFPGSSSAGRPGSR
jgi:Putative translation initiation inhibitor, yjgF family